MRTRFAASAAAVLLAVGAAGVWLAQEGGEEKRTSQDAVSSQEQVQTETVAPTVPSGRARTSRSAPPDIYSQTVILRARAAGGDVKAAQQLAALYDQCASFASSPSEYVSTTAAIAPLIPEAEKRRVYEIHRNYTAQACRGFAESGTQLSVRDVITSKKAAAQMGSLAAEAELYVAGMLKTEQPDYEALLLERVLASRDPEALFALSNAMGVGANAKFGDRFAGTSSHTYAWQLAACRSGMDCGPRSRLITGYCANGGVCGWSFEELLRNQLLPRDEYERVSRLATIIQKEMK